MAGECGTTHTDNTGRFHRVHDVFGCQLRPLSQCHQIGGPVNRLDPFISLHVYKDGRTAVTASIDNRIYLAHFSGKFPDPEAWPGPFTKPSASANIMPTFTSSPLATTGLAGAPIC